MLNYSFNSKATLSNFGNTTRAQTQLDFDICVDTDSNKYTNQQLPKAIGIMQQKFPP